MSRKLVPITKVQVEWAYENCIEHIGRRIKKGVITCLECADTWTDTTTQTHCTCPNCHTKLTITDTKQRVFKQYEYLCTITIKGGFQVIRFFYIKYDAKVGEKARYYHSEVVQRWIAPDGKVATLARLRPIMCFADTWNFYSNLEIRPENTLCR